MRLVRVALANVNSTVGAVQSNVAKAIQLAKEIHQAEVHFAAFPEQMIGGYPPEDLVQWHSFVSSQKTALSHFVEETKDLYPLFAIGLLFEVQGQLYNCAALVGHGKVYGICPKEKLPFYNVFYEGRTLSKGVPFHVEHLHLTTDQNIKLMGPHDDTIPFGDLIFSCEFGIIALEVCEDIWSPDGPMRRRCFSGAELVANLSASPFRIGITETRQEMINTRSSDNHATVLYINAVGANDGLVFDGGGYVSQNGRTSLVGTRFQEGFNTICIDLDRTLRLRQEDTTWRSDCADFFRQGNRVSVIQVPASQQEKPKNVAYPIPPQKSFFLPLEDRSNKEQLSKKTNFLNINPTCFRTAKERFCEDLLDAIALGIGDYFEKTKAFRSIGIALSGGRDSLLCLLLAHRYFIKKFSLLPEEERQKKIKNAIQTFYMPGPHSSIATQKAAELAAIELGVSFEVISIIEAFEKEVIATKKMLTQGEELSLLTLQNIQARIRGERMWNWSNSAAGLFLQPSNMSEKAVGYTTIGGDMMGCLSPIANVPKTVIQYLLHYLQETQKLNCIEAVLAQPASAELASNQEDEKDLMPFAILDSCLMLFVEEKLHPSEVQSVLLQMFPEYSQPQIEQWVHTFIMLFTRSIFKWVQMPLSIHVGHLDLDRERALQIPVVSQPEWLFS